MPAYNFKKQFVEPIRSGKKHTTIRPYRKHPTQVGDTLHLFTGQRTKQCEKIGVYRCKSVQPVTIWPEYESVEIDDDTVQKEQVIEMAHTDGFEFTDEFFQFFLDVYGEGPLRMQLITWEPLQ